MAKTTTTIELTDKDREHIRAIQAETGDTTNIGTIRLALRLLANSLDTTVVPPRNGEEQA